MWLKNNFKKEVYNKKLLPEYFLKEFGNKNLASGYFLNIYIIF